MLTLSRKIGEKIVLDTGCEVIEIMVRNVLTNRVKLAIGAPQSVRIRRPDARRQTREDPHDEYGA